MKSTCAPDNIACVFDSLVSNPAAMLHSLDLITLGVLWCLIALFGAYLITRG